MTDTNSKVREHYNALGLTDRIKAALPTITPESEALAVAQLAPIRVKEISFSSLLQLEH
jgi:hypothetical protein